VAQASFSAAAISPSCSNEPVPATTVVAPFTPSVSCSTSASYRPPVYRVHVRPPISSVASVFRAPWLASSMNSAGFCVDCPTATYSPSGAW
jgi:hypothetical protein